MTKIAIVGVFLLFASFFGMLSAQSENSTIKKSIGINLTKALFPFSPSYEVSFLKPINQRWMLDFSVGYGNKNIMPISFDDFVGEEYQLKELAIELRRFYTHKEDSQYDFYYAGEIFFLRHTDVLNKGDFYDDGQFYSYDKTNYTRDKYGINLKLGLMSKKDKRIKSDYYIGLGYAIRNVNFSNSENLSGPTDGTEREDDEGCISYFVCGNYLQSKGIEEVYNLVVGLNLLYQIKK